MPQAAGGAPGAAGLGLGAVSQPVLQTLTQLQLQGRHRDSGLEAIRVLIIRITGVVSSHSFACFDSR